MKIVNVKNQQISIFISWHTHQKMKVVNVEKQQMSENENSEYLNIKIVNVKNQQTTKLKNPSHGSP